MKHKILFGAVVSFLLLVSLGCATAPASSTAPTFVTTESFNTKMSEMQSEIDKKASSERVDSMNARMDNLAGGGNTYTKGELYTKAEVDAKVAAAIAALKSDQAWITGSTTTTTTTANGVTVKTYTTSPGTIYGANEYTIFVELKNSYTVTKKVLLMGTLTPNEYITSITPCTNCDGINIPNGTQFWTTNLNVQGAVAGQYKGVSTSLSPSNGVNCALIVATTGQIFIGGNSTLLIPITFKLVYSAGNTIWTPAWSVTVLP